MRLCEARGWYEPDKSIESRIYCFGDEGGEGDASDVEAGRQGMGPAASGPQKSLGAKSDVADYSKDDSDRRVQSTGSTTNVNIDRSQPSVLTDRGRVYGTQANLDKAVERGDINITPSPIDSYTPGTSEARSAFTSAGGILSQDRSGQPAAGPALASSNIFTPTAITAGFSPVTRTRAMSPFEISLAESLGPRPQQTMSPVDRISIFEDFEQPLDANNPPTALDPSRPMTQFIQMPATPAEQITQSALAPVRGFGVPGAPGDIANIDAARRRLDQRGRPTSEEINVALGGPNLENLLNAVQQQESGTTGGLVSDFDEERIEGSAGEIGRFQVRPSTAVNPGYGITPIANTEEEARVLLNDPTISRNFAREYLQAAQREFPGDTPRQIAAYNRGIAGASRLEDPASDAYVQDVLSNLDTRQTAPAPVADQGIASVQGVDVARFTDPLTGGVSDTQTPMGGILDYYETPGATLKLTTGDDAYKASLFGDPEGYMTPEEVKAFENQSLRPTTQQEEPISGAQDLREVLGRQDIFAPPAGFDETDLATMPGPEVGLRGIRADNLEGAARAQRAIDFEPNPATPGATLLLGGINAIDSFLGGNQAQKIIDVSARPGGQTITLPNANNVVVGAIGPSANPFSDSLVYVGDPSGFEQAQKIAEERGLNLTTGGGTQDPVSGIREGEPGVDYSPQPLTDRDDRGDNQPILPPLLPEDPMAEQDPEEYVGRDVIGGGTPTGFQPRGPLQIAYTGLPTLAPVVLRPTFQSRAPFSPLFGNLGQPRRS